MLRLKNRVPASWIALAHRSMRSDFGVSRNCSVAALVKKIEPAKNTAASATAPTSWTKPGNGPTTKHAEPMANSTPIHQERCRGAHTRQLSHRTQRAAFTPIG